QTLNTATVTLTNGATDTLTVTTPLCTFNFGSVVVGDYVTATATFTSSAITWNPATNTLTITLGTFASGTRKTGAALAQKYTPVAAIADLAGNAMAATQFTDSVSTSRF